MKFDILEKAADLDNKPLTFGKYEGETPNEIAEHNPQYIVWMYDNLDYKNCTLDLRNECEEMHSFEDEKEMDNDFGFDGWGH